MRSSPRLRLQEREAHQSMGLAGDGVIDVGTEDIEDTFSELTSLVVRRSIESI